MLPRNRSLGESRVVLLGLLHKAQCASDHFEFVPHQCIREAISNLLIRRDVLHVDLPALLPLRTK
jgi:hypothetical protein